MVKDKSDSPQAQTPDAQRRQLLRGLSAIPVVATLTPVSASALSLACNAPEKGVPNLPTGVTAGTQTGSSNYLCAPTNTPIPSGYTASVAPTGTTTVYNVEVGAAAVGDTNTSPNEQCVIYIDGTSNLTFDSTGGNNPIAVSCLVSLGLTQITPP